MVDVVEVIPHDSKVVLLGGSDGASTIGSVDVKSCSCGGRWYFHDNGDNLIESTPVALEILHVDV